MSKKEKYCYSCDINFHVKSITHDPIKFCPFCGSELEPDENLEDEFDEEDLEQAL
jgi:rRNA maturation endonuclease Nob1